VLYNAGGGIIRATAKSFFEARRNEPSYLLDDMYMRIELASPAKRAGHACLAVSMAQRYSGQTPADSSLWKMYLCFVGLKDFAVSPSDVRICHAIYGRLLSAQGTRCVSFQGLLASMLDIMDLLRDAMNGLAQRIDLDHNEIFVCTVMVGNNGVVRSKDCTTKAIGGSMAFTGVCSRGGFTPSASGERDFSRWARFKLVYTSPPMVVVYEKRARRCGEFLQMPQNQELHGSVKQSPARITFIPDDRIPASK